MAPTSPPPPPPLTYMLGFILICPILFAIFSAVFSIQIETDFYQLRSFNFARSLISLWILLIDTQFELSVT